MNKIINTNNKAEIRRIASSFENRLVEKGVQLEKYSTTAHSQLITEYCENHKIHQDCTGKDHAYRCMETNVLLLDFTELSATTGDCAPLAQILSHNSRYNCPYIEFPDNIEPIELLLNTYRELVKAEEKKATLYDILFLLSLLVFLPLAYMLFAKAKS